MSTAKNTIVREIGRKSIFESAFNVTDSAVSYNQGDLLVFNATTHKIVKPSAESEGSTFLGTAVVTVVNGKLKSPYSTSNDAAIQPSDIPGPAYGVSALVKLKNGDALASGEPVYLYPAGGEQHVQVAGTKAIGVYQGKNVTGGTDTNIEVLLGARYYGDVLKF